MTVWAVVPVKAFALAKQRLAVVLAPWERQVLSRLMLHDTLEALAGVPQLAGRLVVTADPGAAAVARQVGAEVLPESGPGGLNTAVALAAQAVQARRGSAMLVVPGDVPGLKAAELADLIDAHLAHRGGGAALSLVPAHDGEGTNGWLSSPPGALAPAFGPQSFERHRQLARQAGIPVHSACLQGLGLDLDEAVDLSRYASAACHAGTRTARFLGPRRARVAASAELVARA